MRGHSFGPEVYVDKAEKDICKTQMRSSLNERVWDGQSQLPTVSTGHNNVPWFCNDWLFLDFQLGATLTPMQDLLLTNGQRLNHPTSYFSLSSSHLDVNLSRNVDNEVNLSTFLDKY